MAAKLPPLDQIDPVEAWQPWRPTAADPWGRKWAAHLYRRAAFGPNREELLEAERLGPQGALELLLAGRPQAEELLGTITDIGQIVVGRDDGGEPLSGWWLYCILQGGHPLREKMTLFWHNHFATSMAKVQDSALMFRQNCLLRKHALGKFGPFLQDISRDGAMLVWLDSNRNVKGRPNENYARELMELFSLGVGNYTEKDVREAARAFTGWHTDGVGFRFDAGAHDNGPKTVLGQSGPWDGGDVVRIALQQPANARFLVRKLYHFLISENVSPPAGLLEPLCESFRKSDHDIGALVKTMLASRHFYSDYAFRQRVKGPVEYVLGAVRAVYHGYPEGSAEYRPLPQQVLVGWLKAMGQQLFLPPNVKGWPGGPAWLSTFTVLERANFAAALALWTNAYPRPSASTGEQSNPRMPKVDPDLPEEPAPPRAYDPARIAEEEGTHRPDEIIRILLDLYLPGGIPSQVQMKLSSFLSEGKPQGSTLERRVREVVHAILAMAEYQLA
jgi:Protein of unknown function (DUF1800)